MGSKGTVQLPQSQNTASSVTPNPVALAAYSDLVGRAQGVGSTPYQPYGGPLVQGFAPQQSEAFNEVGGLQGAAQPYIDKGAGLAMAGATAADPTHFGANVGAYESPYTDQVVNATMANINETNAQQQNSVVGDAIAKGAMGGDRVGVAQAELAREQNLTNNQTLAGLRNTGFQNATAELNQGAAAQGQGAYSMGALGNEAQSTGLAGANALLQTGGLQQQLGQANLSTAYQQFLNQQAYPFQNLSWLSGIINGTGPNMGSSSTGATQGYTSQLAPNSLNSVLGLGTAALGLFSDERVKEDVREVGKLNDGQKLYRYRYKGHPEYHVGLIAQEVEKRHPDAVGSVDGIKTVDYHAATHDAVRAHKAGGGGLSGIPYADFASGGLGGVVGYVPAAPQISARGLQLPAAPQLQQPHANSGQAGQDIKLPSSEAMGKAGTGLGNLFNNSSLGDSVNDFLQDAGDGLARGGSVRRGYDDGGTVLDDTGGLGDLIEGRSAEAPRSTRNNNPGNIEDGPFAQGLPGYAGTDGRFARFETPEHGTAAQDTLLQSYGKRGFNTPAAIVGRWAPSAENGDDSTGAYTGYVAKRLGVDPNTPLDLNDPQVRAGVRSAMAAYEAGTNGQTGAMAYDGATPSGGGLGAIAGATQGDNSGGLGAVGEGRSADDGTGSPSASTSGLGGILGKINVLGLPDNARTALIAAGLGMAASKSHWLGPAIGEGGLAGIKAYETQQKTGIAQQTANQSGENIKSEVATRKGQLGISQQQVEQRAKELGIHLEQVRNQGRNIDSEIVTRKGQLGISQQQAGQQGQNIQSEIETRKGQLERQREALDVQRQQANQSGRNIDSEIDTRAAGQRDIGVIPGVGYRVFDKAHPEKGVQIIPFSGAPGQSAPTTSAPTAPAAPSAPSLSSAPAAGASPGPVASSAGAATAAAPQSAASSEPPRGASGMMNWKPVTSVPQGFIPENHMNIFTDQKTADREGTIAEKMIEQNRTEAKGAYSVLSRLDEMDHAIDNLPKTGFLAQGTGAEQRALLAKTGNTVANFFHLPNAFDESQIGSIENMSKDTKRLGFDLSRQIGGREPGFIVTQAISANPGVENTATGYRRIVSGLREAARYQQDRNTFMDDYYAKFHHINGAEDAFAKANPPQKYVDRAIMSTIDPRDAKTLQGAWDKNPASIDAFDAKYGKGSSKLVLGNP